MSWRAADVAPRPGTRRPRRRTKTRNRTDPKTGRIKILAKNLAGQAQTQIRDKSHPYQPFIRWCLWLRSQFRHEKIFWRITKCQTGKKENGGHRAMDLLIHSLLLSIARLLCQSLFVHNVPRTTRAGAAPWLDTARRSDRATLHRRPRVRLVLSQHLIRHHLLVLIRFVLASLAR